MDALDYRQIVCPYCGEPVELTIDATAGSQAYIEDCGVCCRPIEVRVRDTGGSFVVEVGRDTD